MTFNTNKSHFGYYRVGDYLTFSKFDALDVQQKLGGAVTWHFNDEVYSSYDWGKEPKEDLNQLYMDRARQLRAKYDYLVLMYSGGSDSYNMVMSFINAGIPIDEVACLTYYKGDAGNRSSAMNREIYESAMPTAYALRDSNPIFSNMVIREIDMTDIGVNLFKNMSMFDYLYYTSNCTSVWNISKSFIRESIPALRSLCQEKKVGFVHGSEKPQSLIFYNGKFIYRFKSMLDGVLPARTQELNRPEEHDEFFYQTPDAPLITIKQVHIIKNFIRSLRGPHEYTSDVAGSGPFCFPVLCNGQFKTYFLTTYGLNKLIYPWYDSTMFSQPKAANMFYTLRDQWFYKSQDLSNPYTTALRHAFDKFDTNWGIKDDAGQFRSPTYFYTKPYIVPLK